MHRGMIAAPGLVHQAGGGFHQVGGILQFLLPDLPRPDRPLYGSEAAVQFRLFPAKVIIRLRGGGGWPVP
jgi:hypothetical protein